MGGGVRWRQTRAAGGMATIAAKGDNKIGHRKRAKKREQRSAGGRDFQGARARAETRAEEQEEHHVLENNGRPR